MAYKANSEKRLVSEPPGVADGVTYTTSEAAPGLKLFRCEPYQALMSAKSCATRWAKAQAARGELGATMAACGVCAIGAAHAGHGSVHYSPHYKSPICPRCGTGTTRMIGNRLCISCYNRNREMKAGRNARGHYPVELMERPLHRVEMMVEVDGEVRRLVDLETCSTTETMIQFLRSHTGKVAFGLAPGWVPPSAPVLATEPADDHAVDAGVEPEEPAPEMGNRYRWLLTDNRCEACGGPILRSAWPPLVHQCASCGAEGEGQPEACTSDPPVNGEAAPELVEASLSEVNRYRARLFATAAYV